MSGGQNCRRACTPAQLLGRHAVGCEGTHGVFPKCNLTCTPCYHSADANKVRVDGQHTVAKVDAQSAGPRPRTDVDDPRGLRRRLPALPGARRRRGAAAVSFAAHFDTLMRGRRGAVRPRAEAELHPFRRRFVQMFRELRAETGLRYCLAHNMTVTPANLGQVAETVQAVLPMGYIDDVLPAGCPRR
jgi:hypothetical protein